MATISGFLLMVFVLNVPKDSASKAEFARLSGGWKIVQVVENGKPDDNTGGPTTVIFRSSSDTSPLPANALLFRGGLKAARTRKLITIREVSLLGPGEEQADRKTGSSGKDAATRSQTTVSFLYRITGDTMVLLMPDEGHPNYASPTSFTTSAKNPGVVFKLRRERAGPKAK